MEQIFNIADHGDLLERKGVNFIRNKFPFYESVWSVYIGNIGNNQCALLPNYPNEDKRKSFAEHSYTTFESCFMIQHILDSQIFLAEIDSYEKYIELNNSFIAFFTYLGRVRDTVVKAAEGLNYDCTSFKCRLQAFYEARCIVIHGKKVPIMIENGFLTIPILKTQHAKGNAWDDKSNNWSHVHDMITDFLSDTCESYFEELLKVLNNEYARFLDIIMLELKELSTTLQFDRSKEGDFSKRWSHQVQPSSSGVIRPMPAGVDVYNLNGNYFK